MVMKLGDACFNAPSFAACAGVNVPLGVMHRAAATIGEICQPVAGSTARFSSANGSERVGGLRSARRHPARNLYR